MASRFRERGEGKVGCIISLVVLIIAVGAGIKLVPVYYSNNAMLDAATRKAETAAGRQVEDMVKELKEEARRLEIPEALAAGAITMSKRITGDVGSVTVTMRYSRKVDLYGITTLDIVTDQKIDRPLLEGVK